MAYATVRHVLSINNPSIHCNRPNEVQMSDAHTHTLTPKKEEKLSNSLSHITLKSTMQMTNARPCAAKVLPALSASFYNLNSMSNLPALVREHRHTFTYTLTLSRSRSAHATMLTECWRRVQMRWVGCSAGRRWRGKYKGFTRRIHHTVRRRPSAPFSHHVSSTLAPHSRQTSRGWRSLHKSTKNVV